MSQQQTSTEPVCVVCVDMGTTNTRVWLVKGDQILTRATDSVGVRDTARDGSSTKIRQSLHSLIQSVRKQSTHAPSSVIAAGMITSALGLADIPHIPAPAGITELASATRRHTFPDVTDLPVLLVPGVRSGPLQRDPETVDQSDLMRGEETLCAGLIALKLISPPTIVLNLGSHWKAIQIDEAGRIRASVTSLSGEMIHTTQTGTILASALPKERPPELDSEWILAGMKEQRRTGLARTLFCVRLFELGSQSTPFQRMSFLIGAFIAADLDALVSRGMITPAIPVAIVGAPALASAWRGALDTVSIPTKVIGENDVETAFLAGLRSIATGI